MRDRTSASPAAAATAMTRRRRIRRLVGRLVVSALCDGVICIGLVAILIERYVGPFGFARAATMAALALATWRDAPLGVLLAIVLMSYTLTAPYRPALGVGMAAVAGEETAASRRTLSWARCGN